MGVDNETRWCVGINPLICWGIFVRLAAAPSTIANGVYGYRKINTTAAAVDRIRRLRIAIIAIGGNSES